MASLPPHQKYINLAIHRPILLLLNLCINLDCFGLEILAVKMSAPCQYKENEMPSACAAESAKNTFENLSSSASVPKSRPDISVMMLLASNVIYIINHSRQPSIPSDVLIPEMNN